MSFNNFCNNKIIYSRIVRINLNYYCKQNHSNINVILFDSLNTPFLNLTDGGLNVDRIQMSVKFSHNYLHIIKYYVLIIIIIVK